MASRDGVGAVPLEASVDDAAPHLVRVGQRPLAVVACPERTTKRQRCLSEAHKK